MAAPTPRPANLKLLNGRSDGRDSGGRKVNPGPAFKRLPPAKPDDLSDVAAEKWDELVAELSRLQLLSVVQGPALAMACEAYSRWHAARALRIERGLTAQTSQGVGRAPWVAIEVESAKEYQGWCARFGLTPADEQRVTGPEASGDGDDNPFSGA